MKAVVFPSPENVVVQDVPAPACGPDDVIIKISTCGICGTDLHIYRNEYLSGFPLIPGHEFVGTVVEAGTNARAVKVGDRVAADPNLYCGECDECRRQHNNHCLNWQGVGVTRAGGFADIVALDPKTFRDLATYEKSHQFCAGISAVWVNGTATFRDGKDTGGRGGRYLTN